MALEDDVLENKLKTDGTLAADLASSITLGTGQFCTNPGLIVLCDPENKSGFIDQIRKEINEIPLPPMVHANIEANYHEHLTALDTINEDVQLHTSDNSHAAIGVVSAPHFKMNPSLSEEVFGPFSMIVCCQTLDEMIAVAEGLNGQLTATILGTEADQKAIGLLLPKVQPKVGRILFEGVPTGVAVTQAMQHGGPYPASTDSRSTSVGSDAIYRWLRPLAFQDCPDALLPLPLQNQNPLGVQRNVNGLLTNKAL